MFKYLVDLFYPNLCLICNRNLVKGERQLCLMCLSQIPKTNFHLEKDNPVEKRFWGKVPLEAASSYFFFQKGSGFQKLIHDLKYHGNQELGVIMGRYAGTDLLQAENYRKIDAIIPVPLHKNKEAKRGYNQSYLICKGLSEVMEKPLINRNLVRTQERSTQTKKSVFERFENTQGIFSLRNPGELEGKHILLVDDVLTTGSTLEACTQAILQTKNVKVSLFTLALAM